MAFALSINYNAELFSKTKLESFSGKKHWLTLRGHKVIKVQALISWPKRRNKTQRGFIFPFPLVSYLNLFTLVSVLEMVLCCRLPLRFDRALTQKAQTCLINKEVVGKKTNLFCSFLSFFCSNQWGSVPAVEHLCLTSTPRKP